MTTPPRRTPIAQRLADLATDAAGLAGAALVAYGAWRAWEPLGFVVAGLFLLAGAWLIARRSAA